MGKRKTVTIAEILNEAYAEDAREGSRFDRDGWGIFFVEDWKKNPEVVWDAWRQYEATRNAE